jgi:hypothetical protein
VAASRLPCLQRLQRLLSPALARLQPLCSSGATAACRATATRPLYSLPLHSSQRSGPFLCARTHGFSLCPVPLARPQTSASFPSLVPALLVLVLLVLMLAHASSPPIPRRGPSGAQGLKREALNRLIQSSARTRTSLRVMDLRPALHRRATNPTPSVNRPKPASSRPPSCAHASTMMLSCINNSCCPSPPPPLPLSAAYHPFVCVRPGSSPFPVPVSRRFQQGSMRFEVD